MPAYNESGNIENTIKSWYSILNGKSKQSKLVVADSGSTDDTHKILQKLKKAYSQLEIISDTAKQHGPKVIALYQYAIKNSADYIFQTDSDGQTNPTEFEAFWQLRNNYDCVIGNRKTRGDGKIRTFVEKVVCLMVKLFFDVRVPDANAPFRLVKTTTIAKYLNKLSSDYAIPNIILTSYFARFEKTTFKEISFKSRIAGTNSINLKKILGIGRKALASFFHFRKDMRKTDPKLAKRIQLHKLATLGILAIFSFATLVISTSSPSHPWNRGEPVTDSSVFLTIGTQMKAGLTPYRDTFDHKGPFLFVINYLGVAINQTSGIIIFECLAIFTTFIILYKISRLKCRSRLLSVVLSLVAMSLYITINQTDRGNLTEEYAMPFIAIAIYIFADYFLNYRTTPFRVFLVGLSFACVAMLRINMVAVWVVFCLAILFQQIKHKTYGDLLKFVAEFLLGILAVVVPIIIWLAANGATGDFVNIYFVFNSTYTASKGCIASMASSALYFISLPTVTLSLITCLALLIKRKDKFLICLYLLTILASIATAAMSGRIYPHYGMILTPLIVFPLAYFGESLRSVDKKGYVAAAFFIIIIFEFYTPWTSILKNAIDSFDHRQIGEPVAESLTKPCEIIERLTSPTDKISVYGNRNSIYLRCNRLPATKYSYQSPIGEVSSPILEEYFRELADELPKIIVVQAKHEDEKIRTFLNANNYNLEWEEPIEDGTKVYSLKSRQY